MSYYKKAIQKLLEDTGIVLNGPNPWDPQIKDERFYKCVITQGTLGLGEAYMKKWWTCNDPKTLNVLFYKVLRANAKDKLPSNFSAVVRKLVSKFINLQTKKRALDVGRNHYDVGNDLYELMLDNLMTYTCGYWEKGAQNLDSAQWDKLHMTCEKLNLPKKGSAGPRFRILDIGCGWGSFARFAVENYHVEVVGVTISNEQCKLAQTLCKDLPIEIRFQDYRDVPDEPFDAIVSLGMFEHVGPKNYREFFKKAYSLLKPGGLLLLHTIGGMNSVTDTDPWIEKYIFSNSVIPSAAQITKAAEGLLIQLDMHNFGTNYAKTLRAWYTNIMANWHKLDQNEYNETFRLMWEYYLLTCEASFDAQYNHLFQFVFVKGFMEIPYKSKRFFRIGM